MLGFAIAQPNLLRFVGWVEARNPRKMLGFAIAQPNLPKMALQTRFLITRGSEETGFLGEFSSEGNFLVRNPVSEPSDKRIS
jgi:hypothetical protein